MKTNKVFSSGSIIQLGGKRKYQIIGLKGNDHCRCFDDQKFGILKNGLGVVNKNVPGYYFTINTIYRCKNYLIVFFHKKFKGVWTDKRRTV